MPRAGKRFRLALATTSAAAALANTTPTVAARKPVLPLPAATIIAHYLNLRELLMVALVSKAWNWMFTTDAAWAHHNVYGLKKDVYQHFLECIQFDKASAAVREWISYTKPPLTRPYFRLTRTRSKLCDRSFIHGDKNFFWALASGVFDRDVSFENLVSTVQSDKQLVYALLRAGVSPDGLDPKFHEDPQAVMYYRKVMGERVPLVSPKLLEDPAMAVKAVCAEPAVWNHLPAASKNSDLIFQSYVWSCAEFLRRGRGQPLRTLPRHAPDFERLILAFGDDWQVVWAALSSYHPIKWRDAPRISPAILANKQHVLELFGLNWGIPLGWLPSHILSDPQVLQLCLDKIERMNPSFKQVRCPLWRRLIALAPLGLSSDLGYVCEALELPSANLREAHTRKEMRAQLVELLGFPTEG